MNYDWVVTLQVLISLLLSIKLIDACVILWIQKKWDEHVRMIAQGLMDYLVQNALGSSLLVMDSKEIIIRVLCSLMINKCWNKRGFMNMYHVIVIKFNGNAHLYLGILW